MRYAVIEKTEGETPLMALEALRAREHFGDVPMTYAGRLDPMASGKLLILIGDECKRRAAYDGLDKEYAFEILFGFSSDTGDILGLADACVDPRALGADEVRGAARLARGAIELPYPAYSSKPQDGKPRFTIAREHGIEGLKEQLRRVRVHQIHVEDTRAIRSSALHAEISERLKRLKIDASSTNPYKDFRLGAVQERWDEVLGTERAYTIARVRTIVSSGTYIRALAPWISNSLGACGLAYSIRRTRIGRFVSIGSAGVWLSSY